MKDISKFRCLAQKIKKNLFFIFQTTLIVLLFSMFVLFVIVICSENPRNTEIDKIGKAESPKTETTETTKTGNAKTIKWIADRLGISDGDKQKSEILKFLGIGMGGILVALQALVSYKRAKAMEDTAGSQAKATEEQAKANENTVQEMWQERLKNAIEYLGSQSDSVRLSGAYELFHVAKDPKEDAKELRQTVLDILCAHIRWTTGKKRVSGSVCIKTLGRSSKHVEIAVYSGSRDFRRSPYRIAGKLAERSRSQASAFERGYFEQSISARG